MNTAKFHDFFKPEELSSRIHIIGCGAIGSLVAETLARMGIAKITLYDFDVVSSHNIANQIYVEEDIGKFKLDALSKRLLTINPDIDLKLCRDGYTDQILNGYIFLCVDNIDTRRMIVEKHLQNQFVKGVFDFRMRLTDAQHFCAQWNNPKEVKSLLNSMQFTHEEAMKETPVSACNLTQSIIPTVWMIVSLGTANFVNMVKGEKYKTIIYTDAFVPSVEAY